MTNYQGYVEDLARQDEYYKTSIKEFVRDITVRGLADRFREDVRKIGIHYDIYDVAYDFSIPVVMVKHFMRRGA